MELKERYANLKERAEKIELRENQKLEYGPVKLRMLHDDFDLDWKPGDEPHGTMIFTDVMPEPVIIPENPNLITLRKFLADPHSGLPDLETAFQALARLYLGL